MFPTPPVNLCTLYFKPYGFSLTWCYGDICIMIYHHITLLIMYYIFIAELYYVIPGLLQ